MGIRTIGAQPKGSNTRARQRREWTIDDTDYLTKVNLIGRPRKTIASARATPAGEQSLLAQLQEYRFEEFTGYAFRLGNIGNVQRPAVRIFRHYKKGAQRIFGFLREHRLRAQGSNLRKYGPPGAPPQQPIGFIGIVARRDRRREGGDCSAAERAFAGHIFLLTL